MAGLEADSDFIEQELIGHGKKFRFHSKCEGFRSFEQRNKNKSREAIVIQERENGYVDSRDSIRDE